MCVRNSARNGRNSCENGLMYRLAYLLEFLVVASVGAVFVFLSDIQDTYGIPGWGIGLIASVGFLSTFPVTLAVSPLADRGYTGILIVATGILAVAGNLLFGFGDSLADFVISRGLLGAAIGTGGVSIRKALIGLDIAGSGKKLGRLLSVGVAGFILGPPLAAQLQPYGFATVFVLFAVATAICAVPVAIWAWNVPLSTFPMTMRSSLGLFRNPTVQGAGLGYALLLGSVGIFDATIDIYLDDLGASNRMIGFILLVIGMPLLLLPGFAGAFVERADPKKIMLLVMAASVITITGYGLIPALYAFAIAGIAHSTVEAIAFPAAQVVTVIETGASQAASGQAMMEAAGAITGGMGAFLGPVVYEQIGARAMYILYGAIVFAGVLVIRNRFSRPVTLPIAPEGAPVRV